ncbi:MAG: alpha/beta fold hydrolase [Burkholderiales bacterium]|nr:alpha/beta fold hydrolase [Burkholderiales bacterium]
MTTPHLVRTPTLEIACEIGGPPAAPAVVLLHGFPYDPRSFDGVAPIVHAAGFRTVVPWLRGFGATRFLSAATPRSGQQAALGHDLVDLLDALGIDAAVLAGYDWGGRAACVAAAVWPARVRGLVTCCGYQIQDIAGGGRPAAPAQEHRFWYQHYFQTERGRAGLAAHRRDLCRLLWRQWSPTWAFSDAAYDASAVSFDNPDFVDVTIHSYRHRMGNAPGEARYAATEALLAAQPRIAVPAIAIHGDADGVNPAAGSAQHQAHFGPRYERRVFAGIGHNPPAEAPQAFAAAVLDLCRQSAWASSTPSGPPP